MKKNVLYGICAAVVVVAIAAALLFVFSGKGETPEVKKPDLSGTWLVVAQYSGDQPMFTPGQVMTFADGVAAMYKDDSGEPYASGSYSINEANQLLLPDLGREYKVAVKTDNCVRLYDTTSTYMLLVRSNPENAEVSLSDLAGSWDVVMKGDQLMGGEVLAFEGSTLSYYKTPGAEATATAEISLTEGELLAPTLNMQMQCYRVSSDTLVLVEQNGIVWELKAAE